MNIEDIVTIVTIVLTAFISLIDLVLNAYVATKQRHIKLTCGDCCEFNYDSDSNEQPPQNNNNNTI